MVIFFLVQCVEIFNAVDVSTQSIQRQTTQVDKPKKTDDNTHAAT